MRLLMYGRRRPAGHPWDSFDRARQLVQAGHRDEAVRIWQQIAFAPGLESRQALQAWHFLRQAGQPPPPDQARQMLGVTVEMPARKGHDLLAAYRDGTARYLNYSGKAVIWEDHSDTRVQAAITDWLTAGQVIASAIGVWEQPSLPPLPAVDAHLMTLTPGVTASARRLRPLCPKTPRPARSSPPQPGSCS